MNFQKIGAIVRPCWVLGFLLGLSLATLSAQEVEVQELKLSNGMEFLLYPRQEQPNIIAAGWIAKVGSVNERPGITGISHFFEHMMFKGTDKIGTRDPEQDRGFREEQEAIRGKLREMALDVNYPRLRRGEIEDPWDPESFTQPMRELRDQLRESMDRHRETIVKNEFDEVYTKLGASGMNAFTTSDFTFYFINVPSNKFELWSWMESDRLQNSVFREFYAERDVVHEERRMRIESTPTGIFQEQFDAMFWQSSPYSWPVIGWSSDLNAYTMSQAKDYYATYYQPANLVGVVVGDFKVEEIEPVIRRYFDKIPDTQLPIPPVVTLEAKQTAEKQLVAEVDAQPQVMIRYHSVPFEHPDSFALEVLAEIMNGRSGRLYKSMVEGSEVASAAGCMQSSGALGAPAKYAGYFEFTAETKGESAPEDLQAAWDSEVKLLQDELVPEMELLKVKNQILADSFRRLSSNFYLLVQIGIYEAMDDWSQINSRPKRLREVTAEDLQRVAKLYLNDENRSVALFYRKAGGAPMDPELAALKEILPPQVFQGIQGQLKQVLAIQDTAQLQSIVQQLESQSGQAPVEIKPGLDYFLKKVKEHLTELSSDSGK